MIIERQTLWWRRSQSPSIVCGRKKRTQRKLSSTIELFISIASSLLTDLCEPGPDVCSHSFLFFFLSLLLLVFLIRERRSSLYIRLSLFSLFGFFPSSSPYCCRIHANFFLSFTAASRQSFSLRCCTRPVRSLVRPNSNNKQ